MDGNLFLMLLLMLFFIVIFSIEDWYKARNEKDAYSEVIEQSKYLRRLTAEERYQRWLETPKAGNAHAYGVRKNEEE